MPKLGGALGVVVAVLAFVPSAGAWTKVSVGALVNTVDPSPVVLPDGHVVIAYRAPHGNKIEVTTGGPSKTVVSGASVGDPQLVQLPNGTLTLFVADQDGVVSFTSSNGGATWTGPTKTTSTDVGDVQSAAVRKDGTPLFTQDGTGFVNVFQGAGGEVKNNVFPRCCGYAETVAVDSHDLAQIAFWSNATGKGGFLYGKLDANGALAGSLKTLSTGETTPRNDRVPLVADKDGNTFVALANGYPTATDVIVETMRDGALAHKVILAKGSFSGNEPQLALSVDLSDRLWAVWTQGGDVYAARSRSHGAHFGAIVHVAEPGSSYALEAPALPDGSVDAIVNNGSTLQLQKLLPGLTVEPATNGVRVLDDGFPVAGATVSGGGKTATTGANGVASLGPTIAAHTGVTVTAAGYAPGSGTTG